MDRFQLPHAPPKVFTALLPVVGIGVHHGANDLPPEFAQEIAVVAVTPWGYSENRVIAMRVDGLTRLALTRQLRTRVVFSSDGPA